jgi:protein O-GlcNAc transferase
MNRNEGTMPGAAAMPTLEALQRAATLHRSGRLEEADRWYLAILDSAPDLFDALYQAGIVAAQRGRFDEALRRLQRAVEVNPESAEAQSDYGNVLQIAGRREEALAHWDRALALKPGFAGAWSNRSVALRELGRLDRRSRVATAHSRLRLIPPTR